jgi:hypothetical protein
MKKIFILFQLFIVIVLVILTISTGGYMSYLIIKWVITLNNLGIEIYILI